MTAVFETSCIEVSFELSTKRHSPGGLLPGSLPGSSNTSGRPRDGYAQENAAAHH